MDTPEITAPSENATNKKRRRPINACTTCRARKVKCDERPNGCLNCERLQLDCVQNGGVSAAAKRPNSGYEPVVGIKRKRTFRSCIPCRDSKVKCSGERPTCTRCQQRRTTCIYDAEHNEPAWVQTISTPAISSQENSFWAMILLYLGVHLGCYGYSQNNYRLGTSFMLCWMRISIMFIPSESSRSSINRLLFECWTRASW